MGRKKNRQNVEESVPLTSTNLTFTLKHHCGCCNKKFSKVLGKTRKFMNNLGTDGKKTSPLAQTLDIWEGLEEIFQWRYGKRFAGNIDKSLALCPSCGFVVAKLYTIIKMFEEAKAEIGYLSKIVENVLMTNSKGTDTSVDEEAPVSPVPVSFVDVAEIQNDEQTVFTLGFEGGDKDILVNFCEDQTPTRSIKDNSDKAYLCHFCSAGFNKETNLTRHLLLSHEVGDREKEFQCNVCGKEFYFSYLLKNHEKIHGEVRAYVCTAPNCKASFKCKLGLHAHVKYLHHESRPYKCRYCSKDFKELRILRNHERFLHMLPQGMQPWSCEFCGMRYRRKSILRTHQVKCPRNPDRVRDEENEIDAAVRSLEVGMEVTVEANSELDQDVSFSEYKSDFGFT